MIRGRPSQTAEVVCLLRATDQPRRPAQRILDDPYARWFLGPLTSATLATREASGRLGDLAERLSPGVTTLVLVRHRLRRRSAGGGPRAREDRAGGAAGGGLRYARLSLRDGARGPAGVRGGLPRDERQKGPHPRAPRARGCEERRPPCGNRLPDRVARGASPRVRLPEREDDVLRLGGRVDVPDARGREGDARRHGRVRRKRV